MNVPGGCLYCEEVPPIDVLFPQKTTEHHLPNTLVFHMLNLIHSVINSVSGTKFVNNLFSIGILSKRSSPLLVKKICFYI